MLAGTGTEPVQLGLVQPPGKRPMPAADWGRGLHQSGPTLLGWADRAQRTHVAGAARTPPDPAARTRADPVRRVAYDVLAAVDERGAYANLMLPALLRERGIEGRDAALATELTYGTLRGRQTYDAILDLCSDRPPPTSTRRSARCCGSAPTSCWPPGWPATPRWPRRWTWPRT